MSIKKHIVKATIVILLFSVLGKLFGFAREIIIAAIFGTTSLTDAYFVGLSVPDFFREIISGGILTAVFIPVYASFIQKNESERSLKFINTISTALALIMVLSVIVFMPLSGYLVKVFAPDLTEPAFSTAVTIAKIIFPATIFMGIASFYGSLLNVHKHFVAPALTQLMLNLGVIAGVIFLSKKLGVYSLAVGFVAGAVMQLLVLFPSLRLRELSFKFTLQWFSEFKPMFYLWGPLLFASVAGVGIDLVSRALASGLDSGNIAALIFAGRIRETVWLFCGVPLGTAVFPFLSSVHAGNNSQEFKKIVDFAIRITVLFALPFSLFTVIYSKPIISILFERGAFSSFSTEITSSALAFYSIGALFYALNFVVIRIYYSRQDVITPLKIFSIGFVLNLVAGFMLRKYMLVGGVALARSLTDAFCFIAMIIMLKPILAEFKVWGVIKNILQILLISIISLLPLYLVYISIHLPAGLFEKLVFLSVAVFFSVFIYLLLCKLFKVKELDSIYNLLKRKIFPAGVLPQ
ncbi:MAG: murein biosynthesis integral membrane protein MurJ [Elusimicrobia bacterium]|nr:murein biosynthesis integral membrane protein MurJ [Elusimicrobiota bacterium]